MTEAAREVQIHLVSDATGETIAAVARACLVQFEGVEPVQHIWSMVRTARQLEKVIGSIRAQPGVVLFTFVDNSLRARLMDSCAEFGIPCIPVLDAVIAGLSQHLNQEAGHVPGRQHLLDSDYFARIEAINFVMGHDDGQATRDLSKADVVLVGVSRTSKTPTCIYLANRGIKAANVPLVPGREAPPELLELDRPLIVGLTIDPAVLVQVRRNRMRMIAGDSETDYTDLDVIKTEVVAARRLFHQRGWPVLDVSRRSIEETAAAIMRMLQERGTDVGAKA